MMSCGKSEESNNNIKTVDDSLAVTIGVFPSLDALPLILANDWGIMDSLGISAKFYVYRSQMDCEKALSDNKVDVAMTDMFRVAWWQWQKKPMRFAYVTRRQLSVVPNKALRMTNIDQLDDHMIAMSRFSLDDYYCDKVIKLIKKRKGQILTPQINSVELRLKMLKSGQVDAAILSQMQVYKAKQYKNTSLDVKLELNDGFAGIAFNTNSLTDKRKRKQMYKLMFAYNIVVNKLAKMKAMPEIDSPATKSLFLDNQTVRMINPKEDFILMKNGNYSYVEESVKWLKQHSAIGNGYMADTLLVE